MKAVITVTGKDTMGIIAKVASSCAEYGANIIDISQSVLRDYFAMIMLVDIDRLYIDFGEFVDKMKKLGEDSGLIIQTMHDEIFTAMHTI